MVNYRFATLIGLAGMAVAVPLNINLGAYSPALVVGDGEISFGGGEEVSSLLNALEGAAVNAANGAPPANKGGKKAGAAAIASAQGAAAAAADPVSAASQPQSQIASAPATANPASAPNPALEQQAQQIAALQGMGKAIAPRTENDAQPQDVEAEAEEDEEPEAPIVAKRDLAGFQAALAFADKALTKGPTINLGTGKEGKAGVGIVVNNNPPAAGGKGKARKKRDLGVSQKVKVTTMYVRSGIPASLRNSPELVARDIAIPVGASLPRQLLSRSDSALDAVNLNVDGDKGLTMTFVETITDANADDSAE